MLTERQMCGDDSLSIDYAERDGFLVGKAAAIAEWSIRKEQAEFGKLVNRLRVRKWQRENPEKHRAKGRKWLAAHREQANERSRLNARRAPRSRLCDVCGSKFELPYPHPKGSVRKRCSDACDRVARNRQGRKDNAKVRRAIGRKVTSCTACGKPGHNRRTCTESR